MTTDKAIKIAIECIQSRMKEVHWKARRYEQSPNVWRQYKSAHKKYTDLIKAIAALEAIQAQGRLF